MSDAIREAFHREMQKRFPEYLLKISNDGSYESETIRAYESVWQAALQHSGEAVVDAVQIVQDCVVMGFLVETVDSSPTHRDLVKRAKALLSAGKEAV